MAALACLRCGHSSGVEQELSRLRRDVHGLKTELAETRGDLETLRSEVGVLRVAQAGVDGKRASSASAARRSPDRSAPVRGMSASSAGGASRGGNGMYRTYEEAPVRSYEQAPAPSLPVVRISRDGTPIEDVGAVDDGSPPILIKMGPTPQPRLVVDESVLRKPDPVLHGGTTTRPGRDAAAAQKQYQQALTVLREERDPARAKALFVAFQTQHPDSDLADNAVYWAGEADLMLTEFALAEQSFRRLLREHPKSNKVRYALLRLGESLIHQGRVEAGFRYLREVKRRFPDSEAATEAEAKLETWSRQSSGQIGG